MRRLLRQLHAWVGLALSLLLFVLAVTGCALVYKEAYWRLVYPELRAPLPALDAGEHARAIAAAQRAFGTELRSVKFPEPGVNAYHLYLTDGEAFLSAHDQQVIDRWRPHERVMSLLFDVHAHLMAGAAGERVGGVVGLLGVFLAVTGLIVWWPTRAQFSVRNLLPRDVTRRTLIRWHRDLGTVASPVLVLLLITGSGLVFYTTAQKLLNGMFGDRVPSAAAPAVAAASHLPAPDSALLARIQAALPDARMVFYYPPRDGVRYHHLRLKRPCELHPNGRSYAYVHGADGTLTTTDACALPPGEKIVHATYPLHAGKAGSAIYKLATFLGGAVLALLSLSGVITYVKKLRARPAQERSLAGAV